MLWTGCLIPLLYACKVYVCRFLKSKCAVGGLQDMGMEHGKVGELDVIDVA